MNQVLLVEPDKLLATTYQAAFKQASVSLHCESSAQGAIDYLDKHHPKLIILELQLAAHNGIEFLYELRSHSDLSQIPVLLHTIIPSTDLALTDQTKKQLGIINYAYKPQTTLEQLIDAAHNILKSSS